MEESRFPPKEIAIYRAVMELMEAGADLSGVKVSDIARRAGIGKGTVYEYFESKQQVIARTLLYCVHTEIRSAWALIEREKGFEAKCRAMLRMVARGPEQRFSLGGLMSDNGLQDLKSMLGAHWAAVEANRPLINEMMTALLAVGVEEGVLSTRSDSVTAQMALFGTVAGLLCYLKTHPERTPADTEHAVDCAYGLLVKALN